jgi:hypothetical protein
MPPRAVRALRLGLSLLLLAGAQTAAALSPSERGSVSAQVRSFAAEIARAVSRDGPLAWQRYFVSGPEFFMGVNGELQFADGAAAARGIAALPHFIRKITLTWGDDLRVDPLTPDLAVLVSSYTEVIVSPQGISHTDHGLFSALAERRGAGWQLRDVHWSSKPPAP